MKEDEIRNQSISLLTLVMLNRFRSKKQLHHKSCSSRACSSIESLLLRWLCFLFHSTLNFAYLQTEPSSDAGPVYNARTHINETCGRKLLHPSARIMEKLPPATEWEGRGCVGEIYHTSSQPHSGRFSPYKIQNAKMQQVTQADSGLMFL